VSVCRVHVEKVNATCSQGEIMAAFSPFGVIDYIHTLKGSAVIKYSVPDAARLAIQRMNNILLQGSSISVSIVNSLTHVIDSSKISTDFCYRCDAI